MLSGGLEGVSVDKDMALKVLLWSVPVIFGAGTLVQMVSSDTSDMGSLETQVEIHEKALVAHSALSGHAVSQTQIQHLTDQQDQMITDQRVMRVEQQSMAQDLAAICQATGAHCGSR